MKLTKEKLEELILLELKLANKIEEEHILGLHGRDPNSYGRIGGGFGGASIARNDTAAGNRDDKITPGQRADDIVGIANEISSFIVAMRDNEEMERWRALIEPMIDAILNHAHEISDQVD